MCWNILWNKDKHDDVTGLAGGFNSATTWTSLISSTRGWISTSGGTTSTGCSTGTYVTYCSKRIGCSIWPEWKGTEGQEDCIGEEEDEASAIWAWGWVSGTFPEIADKGGQTGWSFISTSPHPWIPEGGGWGIGFHPSLLIETRYRGYSTIEGRGCKLWKEGCLKECIGGMGGGPRASCPVRTK